MLDEVTYDTGSATATTGSPAPTYSDITGIVTWTGDVGVGASVTIRYSVHVNNPATGDKVAINTVTSAAVGSTCPPGTTDPACRVTIAVLTPALTIAKTASPQTAVPGGIVTYTITVTNTGQIPYTANAATVTDDLTGVTSNAAYQNDATPTYTGTASTTSLGYNTTTSILTWTGNLGVGASATITYTVIVNSGTAGRSLTNTVTSAAAGSNCVTGTEPGCTATVGVVVAPGTLTFTSQAGVNTAGGATAGAAETYTITVANAAPSPTGASFSDDLTGVLAHASYGHDASDQRRGRHLRVHQPEPDLVRGRPGVRVGHHHLHRRRQQRCHQQHGPVQHAHLRLRRHQLPPNRRHRRPAVFHQRRRGAAGDLCVHQRDDDHAGRGGAVHLHVHQHRFGALHRHHDRQRRGRPLRRRGPERRRDSVVHRRRQPLPVGARRHRDHKHRRVVGRGHPGRRGGDRVRDGHREQPRTARPHRAHRQHLHHGAGQQLPNRRPAAPCSTTVTIPALTITKTAGTTTAVPGQTVTYTITVRNTGGTGYTGATVTDSLAEMIDDASYVNGSAADGGAGAVTYDDATHVLTWTGDLPAGAAAVIITYSVHVNDPDTGDKLLINTVTSADTGSTCPPATTGPACRTTIEVQTPALTITSTASPATATPGAVVTYTLTAADTGQTPYTGATITDDLTGVLDDAAYGADATTTGTVTYTGTAVTWTGNLAPGDTATITFTVTVTSPDTGNHLLASTLTSATAGSNCPAGSADPRCTTTVPVSDLVINFTASADTVIPGGTLVYTATITNAGQTPYYGISVSTGTVALAANVTSDGNVTTTSGTLSIGTTGTVWTGDIPIGGIVTIISPVRVKNPVTSTTLTATAVSTAPGNNCPPGSTDTPLHPRHPGTDPRLDHSDDREHRYHGARPDGHLHRHRHRQRPDRLHRRHRHRDSEPARRRDLQQQRGRDQWHRQLRQPGYHLDRRLVD